MDAEAVSRVHNVVRSLGRVTMFKAEHEFFDPPGVTTVTIELKLYSHSSTDESTKGEGS
jgi:hypothetical protein